MESKFKIGDKVVLKKEYHDLSWLDGDKIYTISNVKYYEVSSSTLIELVGFGPDRGAYEYRFELYEEILTLAQQIDMAKDLIGKKIESRVNPGTFGEVKKIEIYTNINQFSNWKIVGMDDIKETLEKQGVVVVLTGTWDSGRGMGYPINTKASKFPTAKRTVIINKFPGIDKGEYVEFGCAKISKNVLQQAKKFLEDSRIEDSLSNRKIESVKIGAGEFTLENLKDLLE